MNAGTGRLIEILMVEDNPADVRLTVEAFKDAKVLNHLNVVHDGEEAMEYLRHGGKYADAPRPDLILLDLNLPKMDGREVLEEIKKDQDLKRIPVVVLTTSDDERDILKAYDLHVNAYVTKPVALDQFVRIVEAVDDFWFSVVKLPPR
ncbi:MAG: response regulator [Deltaproteobacteria bacterium]|nr:response regulator [Deltaproteobacteria bacterium]